jgi:hypothetical protein
MHTYTCIHAYIQRHIHSAPANPTFGTKEVHHTRGPMRNPRLSRPTMQSTEPYLVRTKSAMDSTMRSMSSGRWNKGNTLGDKEGQGAEGRGAERCSGATRGVCVCAPQGRATGAGRCRWSKTSQPGHVGASLLFACMWVDGGWGDSRAASPPHSLIRGAYSWNTMPFLGKSGCACRHTPSPWASTEKASKRKEGAGSW